MRIKVVGAGWYGCHIASALLRDGHNVEVHEARDQIFTGASGSIPARLHQGFHYPRSRMTRAACQEHSAAFLAQYGFLTRGVPVNIYAIAANHSMVDFDQYRQTLSGEVEFVTIADPAEFGLCNVEGALLTGERHIVTRLAKEYFEEVLGDRVMYGQRDNPASGDFDWVIDCTFCANESAGVDRYEPCLVLLLKGPTDKAVTIMDGPFSSLYPWDEDRHLSSLSSALWTPFNKTIRSYGEAKALLANLTDDEIRARAAGMIDQMASFYPEVATLYDPVDFRLSIRAMPLSGADTRLVDVAQVGERVLRVRAGKIDAVIHAEQAIRERMK